MKFVIVGGGLIGITTAFFLGQAGHEVTVLDREISAGRGASFANGGLLTPSMPEPWNSPGSWRVLLASLGRSDSALQLRWRAIPGLIKWGTGFLANSTPARFQRSTVSNLRLALYSLKVMESLQAVVGGQFCHAAMGTLRLFRSPPAFITALRGAERLAPNGLPFRSLSPSELVRLEPALAPIGNQLTGAIHYEKDQCGNALHFCEALTTESQRNGVRFRFGVSVLSLKMRANQVVAAVTSEEEFAADQFVVAAGSYSPLLLSPIGVRVPVQPVKGYSITIEEFRSGAPLRIPVLDDELHAAVTPLGNMIRVAGTAEFAGYDCKPNSVRTKNLVKLLGAILPDLEYEPKHLQVWSGLRPVSADGVPIFGRTHIPNLFINTGHGPLGWTTAAGSARLFTQIISEGVPEIDTTAYSLNRFNSVSC